MASQHTNGSSTLPRGFRFHYDEQEPKTPEPAVPGEEIAQPSPPRPRFKVKRRVASNFQAPTQQFLASVAAADVPIPTIEEPTEPACADLEMPDREPLSIQTSGFLTPSSFRSGSPPKTPMPESMIDEASVRPDWSAITPSPEYFQRSASSLSTHSDFSDDSFTTGGQASYGGSCTSPESDTDDPFTFPSSHAKKVPGQQRSDSVSTIRPKSRKNTPWTKAQSDHLWSVYMIYLSDPTVTPFRIGVSAVPPQGIVNRVSREAIRSWKGPKSLGSAQPAVRRSSRLDPSRATSYEKSGSITPTADGGPRLYAQWPHPANVTRAHFRELCRTKDSNSVQRHHHFQTRSLTPFTKPYPGLPATRFASTPFSTADIAFSLATSTSETMQPNGPLAQLAAPDEIDGPYVDAEFSYDSIFKESHVEDRNRGRRLASPFMPRTYGPSSSKNIITDRPTQPRTHSDIVAASEPHLGSPLRFEASRSLNVTMKRRAQNPLDEELSRNGAILRPSILSSQFFGAPKSPAGSRRRVRSRGFSLGDEALRHRSPLSFQRSPLLPGLPTAMESYTTVPPAVTPEPSSDSAPSAPPRLLPSVTFDAPARLGSPFTESAHQTFPRRLFQDGTSTIRRSQFATMHHQSRRSIESFDFGVEGQGQGPSLKLKSRLSNLDGKLKEIREREGTAGDA